MAFSDFLKWIGSVVPGPYAVSQGYGTASNMLFGTKFDTTWQRGIDSFDSTNGSSLFSGLSNLLRSFVASKFGNELTQAEVQQNEYNAEREDTRYQRSVVDMRAAGLNPALMYQNGASAPSVNTSAGSPAAGISDILQLAMLPLQMRAAKAQIGATEAQASKDNAEAARTVQQTSFEKDYQPLLLEARQVGNDLTRAERNQINANLDRIAADIDRLRAETKTEETRQQLNIAESVLRNAEASQIIQLMPYRQALMEAQTDNERAQAALSAVNRMYQQRILNSDYLDNMFSAMRAQASSSESKAALDDLHQRIRTGSLINVDDDASLISKIGAGIVNYPVAVVANVLDNASGVIAAGLGAGAAVKVAGLKNPGKQSAPSGLVLPNHTNEFGNTYGYR